MGKKRNNGAKKKREAKKKKISASYGVSVLKGGTIARNNGVIETRIPIDSKPTNIQSPKNNASKMKRSVGLNQNPKKLTRGQSEHSEFLREQASLEERSLIQQAQKNHQRKMKKQKRGWASFAHPSSLAPASFNPIKTTQQLVDDAADQVAQMSDIGQRLAPAEGQSSLAAAAGSNWVANIVQNKVETQQSHQNSFAALGDESDSENEWADMKPKVPQFQFQPASFSFQSSFVPIGPTEDDIDSDL